MKWRRKRRGDKLALSDDIICLINAACDLVLRFAANQLRQKAGYLIDSVSAAVIGLNTDTRSYANQIANCVTMLSHIKQINGP